MFAMHPAIGRRPQAIAEEFGLVPRADRRDPKFAIRDPVMTALDRLRCGYSRHDPRLATADSDSDTTRVSCVGHSVFSRHK